MFKGMVLQDGFGEVVVLFGSQTGNAEAIAGRISKDISSKGGSCSLLCMKDYEKIDLTLERAVIAVVSTTGQGDAPENASKFFRFVKGRTHPKTLLGAWRFAVRKGREERGGRAQSQ